MPSKWCAESGAFDREQLRRIAGGEDSEVDHAAKKGGVDVDVVVLEDGGESVVGGTTVEVGKSACEGVAQSVFIQTGNGPH